MKAKPHLDVEPGHEMDCVLGPRNCDLFQGVKHEDSGRSDEESCGRVQVMVKLPGVPNHSGWVVQWLHSSDSCVDPLLALICRIAGYFRLALHHS